MTPITTLTAERLADLRQRFVAANNFDQFWTFYFDHFAEHPDFYRLSTRIDAPGALPVIEEAASRMLSATNIRTRGLQLFQIGNSDLFHGSCLLGNRLSALLYFSSLHMGMLAMVGEKDAMHYCKFTLDTGRVHAAA